MRLLLSGWRQNPGVWQCTPGFFWKVDFYTVKCNTYCKWRMWGVFFMPDEKVLQVAILIWGCAFCAIAALCIFLSSNYEKHGTMWRYAAECKKNVRFTADGWSSGVSLPSVGNYALVLNKKIKLPVLRLWNKGLYL